MKKNIFIILLMCAVYWALPLMPSYALTVDSVAAVLIDGDTGKILYEQNANEQLFMASTTKIMTALVALEKCKLDATVTVPADFVNVGESSIWLEAGETHTYKDLLYAMLLKSANDAAQAVAIGVAGSEVAFVDLMNAKAQELGLVNTHFTNVHGLHSEQHYTSAADLAVIMMNAMKNETFREITQTKSYQMPWNGREYNRQLLNGNQFLTSYEGATGGKTGYTKQAGSCLVAAATKEQVNLIGVLLNSNGMYNQMTALMDYGFQNFKRVKLCDAGTEMGSVPIKAGKVKSVKVITAKDVYALIAQEGTINPEPIISLEKTASAPIKVGDQLGTVTYNDGEGQKITVPLVAGTDVEHYTFGNVIKRIFTLLFSVFLV